MGMLTLKSLLKKLPYNKNVEYHQLKKELYARKMECFQLEKELLKEKNKIKKLRHRIWDIEESQTPTLRFEKSIFRNNRKNTKRN
jgi:hypothetical protein